MKKTLLIAAGAYYLGHLNLPKTLKYQWKRTASSGRVGQVVGVIATAAIVPITHVPDTIFRKTNPETYSKMVKKMNDFNVAMKFKMELNDLP